ncbi:MAG: hypothetical protein CMP23_04285 [Rickettsiales bacterium]|nr:hypothetical protein [Rickettsiales bacterium]
MQGLLLSLVVACAPQEQQPDSVDSSPEAPAAAASSVQPRASQAVAVAPVAAPQAGSAAPQAVSDSSGSSLRRGEVQSISAQSYRVCVEYCVSYMDDAGAINDSCPQDCRRNPNAYTAADLMSDDQRAGLVLPEPCLNSCRAGSGQAREGQGCEQVCCVESCVLRQEYIGSGLHAKAQCPAKCRDFLSRRARDGG